MSGKLPIDRVREARDAPAVYDDNREAFAQKQAKLEQANDPAEGERAPEITQPAAPEEAEDEADEQQRAGDPGGSTG